MKSFADVFGAAPGVVAEAPGRVNLLGEHTDYNDGFVLPTAIPQKTTVAMSRNGRGSFTVYSCELRERAEFTLAQAPPEQFARYVYGCMRECRARGVEVPPLDIHIASAVPIGAGLSSSAALEVATLRAVRSLLGAALDDVAIAQIAREAEVKYAGVNCGIMDQMASSLADTTSMLFLDARTLERRLLPMPPGSEILVIDSGIKRSLAASKYNERRAECEQAARLLAIAALRDITDIESVERLPEPLRRRARHVVSENERVLRAAAGAAADEFGALMNASHQSLRSDYEVSVPGVDALVERLQREPSVYGARLTGAGFGGACVALCRAGTAAETGRRVAGDDPSGGDVARVLVPPLAPSGPEDH